MTLRQSSPGLRRMGTPGQAVVDVLKGARHAETRRLPGRLRARIHRARVRRRTFRSRAADGRRRRCLAGHPAGPVGAVGSDQLGHHELCRRAGRRPAAGARVPGPRLRGTLEPDGGSGPVGTPHRDPHRIGQGPAYAVDWTPRHGVRTRQPLQRVCPLREHRDRARGQRHEGRDRHHARRPSGHEGRRDPQGR